MEESKAFPAISGLRNCIAGQGKKWKFRGKKCLADLSTKKDHIKNTAFMNMLRISTQFMENVLTSIII